MTRAATYITRSNGGPIARALAALRLPAAPLAAMTLLAGCAHIADGAQVGAEQPQVGSRVKPLLTIDGLQFRDLDANGVLSAYEDWRLSPESRATDLLSRMTVAEKVGAMMHSTMPGEGGLLGRAETYDLHALAELVGTKHVNSLITRLTVAPKELAEQNNAAQEVAERTRLGIPLTISTDPRNHFQYVLGAGESGVGATQWPELLGFAALRDPALVRKFADVARREYRAVGIQMTLSPQLDLLTDPRWPRGTGTFGSDSQLTSALGGAYVSGFQGSAEGVRPDGVMAVVKHWVGYGAQPEGFDAHNYYGRFARPEAHLSLHIDAFRGAFDAQAAGVMPAYPILLDTPLDGAALEAVGPGFSRQLLTGLLRDQLGYEGIILSDWAITRDCPARCREATAEDPQRPNEIATPWGVEDLSVRERYVKGALAGLDQFGGTDEVQPLIDAVEAGELPSSRIDSSVRRILISKFRLGLFENPYVDPAAAAAPVGNTDDVALAERTQREAQVLLENRGEMLPFASAGKVWIYGMDPAAVEAAGLVVVADPADADFAIVRAEAPSEMLHPGFFFGSRQKEGRLDFRDGDPAYEALKHASVRVPTVLAIFLDRPAVLTNVRDKASVILANFGASDAAIVDVLLGRARARGVLPFELPSSMQAVERQHPGVPDDSVAPLYERGAGLGSR